MHGDHRRCPVVVTVLWPPLWPHPHGSHRPPGHRGCGYLTGASTVTAGPPAVGVSAGSFCQGLTPASTKVSELFSGIDARGRYFRRGKPCLGASAPHTPSITSETKRTAYGHHPRSATVSNDFDAYREVYDFRRPMQAAGGVDRRVGSPDGGRSRQRAVFIHEFDSMENARTFFANPGL